jgi:hypothetical protein
LRAHRVEAEVELPVQGNDDDRGRTHETTALRAVARQASIARI